jgi:hypothetical protein
MTPDIVDIAKSFSNQIVGELFPTDALGDAKPQDPTSRVQALCLTIAACTGAIVEALDVYSYGSERYQEIRDERDEAVEESINLRHERDLLKAEIARLKEAIK